MYNRYIGIDYSGAKTPISRLKGLQVFRVKPSKEPTKISTPAGEPLNWTRKEIANWCAEQLVGDAQVVIGIKAGRSLII